MLVCSICNCEVMESPAPALPSEVLAAFDSDDSVSDVIYNPSSKITRKINTSDSELFFDMDVGDKEAGPSTPNFENIRE
ncbi:hypothetical protein NQ314_014509 [Rhamnusium bicolor]|uniref:AGC-kinase C-terminal domain-containing protein n=1 Tax=Rhamnusium bicolor TaxID=1586634 RepID=A0AAV8X2M3_9CUCU|nr:hypothetical protein NQ314_014509 [Rhamnusium bicolor]